MPDTDSQIISHAQAVLEESKASLAQAQESAEAAEAQASHAAMASEAVSQQTDTEVKKILDDFTSDLVKKVYQT
ncbi:hypothetical protein HY224_03185 [Candidatus Uhrbacteria bacterium]|nr:hypothetical protein [Candidatus Uhrbacteria bacterium]